MTTESDTMTDADVAAYDRQERIRYARRSGARWSALADHIEYDHPPRESDVMRALLVYQAISEHVERVYDLVRKGDTTMWSGCHLEHWSETMTKSEPFILVTYRDYDGDHDELEFPRAYLWMTNDAILAAEAERRAVAQHNLELSRAAAESAKRAATERAERQQLAALQAKYGA